MIFFLGNVEEANKPKLEMLADLLDRALMLDPAKRISVKDALKHPFLNSK